MKLLNLVIALLFVSVAAYANGQKGTEMPKKEVIVYDSIPFDNIVVLDKKPEFPGGEKGLMQFLMNKVHWPTECYENKIQGVVVVGFTILKDGKVGNIKVVQSVHPLLDAEAVRVVSLLPNWTPGELDGKPINVNYNLPISFKLPEYIESDKFVAFGDEALAVNNIAHAFAYYKEAFDILPSRTYLIDKCDSLLSGDIEKQEAFYIWAVSRLMREVQSNLDGAEPYISQMVKLQEKIVARHPSDVDMLTTMEFLYYQANDFDKVQSTAQKLYTLIPSSDVATLADVIAMDVNARYLSQDYKGVVALVAPKVDVLFTQPADSAQFVSFFRLIDSYLHLNKKNDAKKLILRLKSTYPNDFDQLLNINSEFEPELHPALLDLVK